MSSHRKATTRLEASKRRRLQKPKSMSPEEERRLINECDAEGIEAGKRLVVAYLPYAAAEAWRWKKRPVPDEDLVQQGFLGLAIAATKFQRSFGTRFFTYAAWWVRAMIACYLRDTWSVVKFSGASGKQRAFWKLDATRKKLAVRFGEDAANDAERLAREIGVRPKDVIETAALLAGDIRLDDARLGTDGRLSFPAGMLDEKRLAKGHDEWSGTGVGTYADALLSDADAPDVAYEKQEDYVRRFHAVASVYNGLPWRERYIAHYRIMADEPMTLQEIGEKIGLSRESIRLIEVRIGDRLRNSLKTAIADQ